MGVKTWRTWDLRIWEEMLMPRGRLRRAACGHKGCQVGIDLRVRGVRRDSEKEGLAGLDRIIEKSDGLLGNKVGHIVMFMDHRCILVSLECRGPVGVLEWV